MWVHARLLYGWKRGDSSIEIFDRTKQHSRGTFLFRNKGLQSKAHLRIWKSHSCEQRQRLDIRFFNLPDEAQQWFGVNQSSLICRFLLRFRMNSSSVDPNSNNIRFHSESKSVNTTIDVSRGVDWGSFTHHLAAVRTLQMMTLRYLIRLRSRQSWKLHLEHGRFFQGYFYRILKSVGLHRLKLVLKELEKRNSEFLQSVEELVAWQKTSCITHNVLLLFALLSQQYSWKPLR